jgi:hypothetical protein
MKKKYMNECLTGWFAAAAKYTEEETKKNEQKKKNKMLNTV